MQHAVVIEGSSIPWISIRPALAEAAGVVVLEEAALDRVLAREADRRGLQIGQAEIQAEENALLDELASVGPNRAQAEVLAEIRRARGLGPHRYQSLLRRNATLRAMVREDAAPSPAELKLAHDLAFGQTWRVRLFVSDSHALAAAVREQAAQLEAAERRWRFADRCVTSSMHPSADRGGLIERFHPSDPAYPSIIGDSVRDAAPDGVTPVMATTAGFAVVLVEKPLPPRQTTADEIQRVEHRVRIRKERVAMENLARDLLSSATVSPLDPDLARAWRHRR